MAAENTDSATQAPSWRRRAGVIGVIVVLAGGAGVGAYFIGHSTGEDLDAARAEGEREGTKEGAARGTEEGYSMGFEAGRKEGYDQAFSKAYRAAYRKAFEDAGLDPPEEVEVPKAGDAEEETQE